MRSNMIESLEDRVLLSRITFTCGAPEENAVRVCVTGSPSADVITVSFDTRIDETGRKTVAFEARLNETRMSHVFQATGMETPGISIFIDADAGNDRVKIVEQNHDQQYPNVLISLGDGDDALLCDTRLCNGYGEAGNDLLRGGDGASGAWGRTFVGGPGDDIMIGSDADDIFMVDQGNDIVFGRGGDDYFQIGGGNHIMLGGDGDDYFVKEYDNMNASLIIGGAGIDTVAVFHSAWPQILLPRSDVTFSKLRILGVELFMRDIRG